MTSPHPMQKLKGSRVRKEPYRWAVYPQLQNVKAEAEDFVFEVELPGALL